MTIKRNTSRVTGHPHIFRVECDKVEIGRISEARVSELSRQSVMNFRNYLGQAFNCLVMLNKFVSRLILFVPLLVFWVLAFGVAFDVDAAGAALTLALREPAAAAFAAKKLLEITFYSTVLLVVAELCCSPRSFGFRDCFNADTCRRICADIGAPHSSIISLWDDFVLRDALTGELRVPHPSHTAGSMEDAQSHRVTQEAIDLALGDFQLQHLSNPMESFDTVGQGTRIPRISWKPLRANWRVARKLHLEGTGHGRLRACSARGLKITRKFHQNG